MDQGFPIRRTWTGNIMWLEPPVVSTEFQWYVCLPGNPNGAPCFAWKRLCFGGLTFKNRGQLGSRYSRHRFINTCSVTNSLSSLEAVRVGTMVKAFADRWICGACEAKVSGTTNAATEPHIRVFPYISRCHTAYIGEYTGEYLHIPPL